MKTIVKPTAGLKVEQPPYGPCTWRRRYDLSSGQQAQALALDGNVRQRQELLCLVQMKTGRVVRIAR